MIATTWSSAVMPLGCAGALVRRRPLRARRRQPVQLGALDVAQGPAGQPVPASAPARRIRTSPTTQTSPSTANPSAAHASGASATVSSSIVAATPNRSRPPGKRQPEPTASTAAPRKRPGPEVLEGGVRLLQRVARHLGPTGTRGARARNSSPSARVRLATERSAPLLPEKLVGEGRDVAHVDAGADHPRALGAPAGRRHSSPAAAKRIARVELLRRRLRQEPAHSAPSGGRTPASPRRPRG